LEVETLFYRELQRKRSKNLQSAMNAKREEAATTVLSTCAGLKHDENLLIAVDGTADDGTLSTISELAKRKFGANVTVTNITGPVTREPPEKVAQLMLQSNIVLFCVNEMRTSLWGHADAKVAVCSSGGRVLFLTQRLEETPAPKELERIRERSQKLGDILEKASRVALVSNEGKSRLDIVLAGRKALRLNSILVAPGNWGAVPDYAEAAVAPLENGSNGTLRVDGMIVNFGKVDSPVDLVFESGKLTKISGGRTALDFEKLLGNDDSSRRILCEVGFGTNHLRKEMRGEFDDKKALGAVHVALGDNHTFGGSNRSSIHIDCLAVSPRVEIDGELVDMSSL
jgi:aminopeptidase